jgi:hypothetical protein
VSRHAEGRRESFWPFTGWLRDYWLATGERQGHPVRIGQVGVAWPPANDTNPVVQDFVRCCLETADRRGR